jgi:hypothetical protein
VGHYPHVARVAPHTVTVVWLAVDLPTEIFGLVKLVLLHLDTMPMMAEKRHVVDANETKSAQKELPHLNLYYTTENGVCQEENKPRSDLFGGEFGDVRYADGDFVGDLCHQKNHSG